jgi:hypothetical protein
MEPVEAQFEINIDQDKKGTGQADGKAENIDEGKYLVFQQVS